MKSFRTYEETKDYKDYVLKGDDLPNVSLVLENMDVYYNPEGMERKENLTFKITSAGNINWMVSGETYAKAITYRINEGEWHEITATTTGTSFSVSVGDIVEFNGVGTSKFADGSNYNTFSGTTAGFIAYGNPLSLCGGHFETYSTINNYEFKNIFAGCTGLTDASGMFFSATTLGKNCYEGMFKDCINLTDAPVLNLGTLAANCCQGMFSGCTSLTVAPDLTATTLASNCYTSMFRGCTSLTTAPNLPATTPLSSCYSNMFNGCINLVTPPIICATTVAASFCSSMFVGCVSLEEAPVLKPTELNQNSVYYGMFNGCTSLKYIKCLATSITKTNATMNWVANVAQNGTFVKHTNMSSWTTGTNGIPAGWDIQNATN